MDETVKFELEPKQPHLENGFVGIEPLADSGRDNGLESVCDATSLPKWSCDEEVEVNQTNLIEEAGSSKEKLSLGWEYDSMVETYRHHKENRPERRYKRFMEGFDVKPYKPIRLTDISDGDELAVMRAYAGQFPLLDGLTHERFLAEAIDSGVQSHLTLLSGEYPSEALEELRQKAIDGAGAFLTMYECNLRLVFKFSGSETSTTYSRMDAIQEGMIGLRRAIQKYDPDKGFKFSTYAKWWINQAVGRSKASILHPIGFPIGVFTNVRQIRGKYAEAKREKKELTNEDLLDFGYTQAEIDAANNISKPIASMDAPINPDGDSDLYNYVFNDDDSDFLRSAEEDESIKDFHKLTDGIDFGSTKHLEVLALRYGLIVPGVDYGRMVNIIDHPTMTLGEAVALARQGESFTLDQLVSEFKVVRERIRQVDFEALDMLAKNSAVERIADRLNMTEGERSELLQYLELRGFGVGRGRRSEDELQKQQQRVETIISLLRLLDEDFDLVLDQTMERVKHTIFAKKSVNVRDWLEARFGYTPLEKPLTGAGGLKAYDLSFPQARAAETIYISELAGIHGNVNDFKSAN